MWPNVFLCLHADKLGDIDDIVNLSETLLAVAHGPIKVRCFIMTLCNYVLKIR